MSESFLFRLMHDILTSLECIGHDRDLSGLFMLFKHEQGGLVAMALIGLTYGNRSPLNLSFLLPLSYSFPTLSCFLFRIPSPQYCYLCLRPKISAAFCFLKKKSTVIFCSEMEDMEYRGWKFLACGLASFLSIKNNQTIYTGPMNFLLASLLCPYDAK